MFKRPGAHHHARFKAKAIYSPKMALLSKPYELPLETKHIIDEAAEFCAIFYGPWFLRSAIPQCAPGNDFEAIKQMILYSVQGVKARHSSCSFKGSSKPSMVLDSNNSSDGFSR